MLRWVSDGFPFKTSLLCFRYNVEQEQKLATETTVLVESYTVCF